MDENVATAVERFDSHFAQRASSLNMTAELNLYEWQTIRARLVELEAENADMAKRLEAAERDAAVIREVVGSWRVLERVSGNSFERNAFKLCADQIDAAIDATQEGEG